MINKLYYNKIMYNVDPTLQSHMREGGRLGRYGTNEKKKKDDEGVAFVSK
jgi:hypothetical protein